MGLQNVVRVSEPTLPDAGCHVDSEALCGWLVGYVLQDIRPVLKEHVRGVTPGLTEGAPILIADESEDREAPADEKLR